jgi:hypothetical protein
MVPAMREADRSEIVGQGWKPRHAMFRLWRESPDPQVGEVHDGTDWRLAAAWGDCGGMLDPVGSAWLFTTDMVERIPIAFFRQARAWSYGRLAVRQRLVSLVRADYACALRFFDMIGGFEVGDPQPMPPHGIPYSVIELRRL